jgi:hypothetical protein
VFNVIASNGVAPIAKQFFQFRLVNSLAQLQPAIGPVAVAAGPLNLAISLLRLGAVTAPKGSNVNTVTLRNDDPDDKFCDDQYWMSGADYVEWEGILTVNVEGKAVQLVYMNNPPCVDMHMVHPSAEDLAAFQDMLDEMRHEKYQSDYGFSEEDGFDISISDFLEPVTALDYGSILGGIEELIPGGVFDVSLGGSNGTVIPGDVFSGLRKHPSATVSLIQKGATVSFTGRDVGGVKNSDLFDFAFVNKAPSNDAILSKIGAAGSSFTYAFAHNGSLPGYGSFAVETGIAEGTKVNVYKFEADTSRFSLIAGSVPVATGGLVSYRNNMTSEYVITTETIAGASISDAYSHQGKGVWLPGQWWFWTLIALVLAGGAFALWFFVIRKRKPAGGTPA